MMKTDLLLNRLMLVLTNILHTCKTTDRIRNKKHSKIPIQSIKSTSTSSINPFLSPIVAGDDTIFTVLIVWFSIFPVIVVKGSPIIIHECPFRSAIIGSYPELISTKVIIDLIILFITMNRNKISAVLFCIVLTVSLTFECIVEADIERRQRRLL